MSTVVGCCGFAILANFMDNILSAGLGNMGGRHGKFSIWTRCLVTKTVYNGSGEGRKLRGGVDAVRYRRDRAENMYTNMGLGFCSWVGCLFMFIVVSSGAAMYGWSTGVGIFSVLSPVRL